MSIKLKDIAKAAGVSEATVSLALNDNEMVKLETQIKVKRIAQEMGYSPNAMARGLAKRKSATIGLIIPDIESAYYGKLVRCVDENVREIGYSLILALSNDKPEVEKQIVGDFISNRVEGIIIAPVNRVNTDLRYIHELNRHRIPCVFATAHYPDTDVPYAMVDLEEGTYRLVKYLLDLGHRNIYFLAGSPKVITTAYRINGFVRAFQEREVIVGEKYFIECGRLDYEQSRKTTEKLLANEKDIDAIITINDMMALGVQNILNEKGIRVPDDISVAGYDNMIFSTIAGIPITTINQDIGQISWNAVNMLLGCIRNGGGANEKVLISPELIIRESTGLKR